MKRSIESDVTHGGRVLLLHITRCLVEDPKARANCGELRDLPFLSVQVY
jgi:hypothetical protein